MELRPPKDGERQSILALLASHALPVQDLGTAVIDFIVAAEDDRVVGVVGIEIFVDVGLLRSLAVNAERRNAGLGVALADAAEALARDRGLSQLVLLTQTAAPFFARRGFVVIERGGAPDVVQASSEFRSLCPASATCMSKSLTPRA